MAKLSRKDRMDIEKQIGRFEKECSEVRTYRVDPAILCSLPVAVVRVRVNQIIEIREAKTHEHFA